MTVLNEYILTSAAVIGELAVLDNVVIVDVEQTDRAAYVVSLVAFEGAVGDAVGEVRFVIRHTRYDEDRACLVVRGIVPECYAVCIKVCACDRSAGALLQIVHRRIVFVIAHFVADVAFKETAYNLQLAAGSGVSFCKDRSAIAVVSLVVLKGAILDERLVFGFGIDRAAVFGALAVFKGAVSQNDL